MHILVVAPYVPWPLHGGNQLRIFHLLQGLRRMGHRLTLVAGGEPAGAYDATPLAQICDRIESVPPDAAASWRIALRSLVSPLPYPFQRFVSDALRARLAEVLASGRFDVVLANVTMMALALPTALDGATLVLDEGESQELVWEERTRSGSLPLRWFSRLNLRKVRRLEPSLMRRADAVAAVSDEEADHARQRTGGAAQVWVVPNGVDAPDPRAAAVRPSTPPRLMFCGNFGVRRNGEAAVWLVRRVFPEVRRRVPDAEAWLVGATPSPAVRRLARRAGVHVTGTVPDVRPFYAEASVVVAPYRYGRGTKLKVLEALAMGRPVVSTSVGMRGIAARPGDHFLLADHADAFATAVTSLLVDDDLARRLSLQGRELVETQYSWDRIVEELDGRLRSLRADLAGAPRPGAEERASTS